MVSNNSTFLFQFTKDIMKKNQKKKRIFLIKKKRKKKHLSRLLQLVLFNNTIFFFKKPYIWCSLFYEQELEIKRKKKKKTKGDEVIPNLGPKTYFPFCTEYKYGIVKCLAVEVLSLPCNVKLLYYSKEHVLF